MGQTHDAVARYLTRLRNRARLVAAGRAVVGGAAAALAAFAVAASGIGPVVSWPVSVAVWLGVGAAFATVFAYLASRGRGLGGPKAARLLTAVDPRLASRTQSAAELARETTGGTSSSLVEAHAVRVREELTTVAVGKVLPWSSLGRGTLWSAIAVALAATGGLATVDRTAAGAFALLHPSARDAAGSPIAAVVSRVEARLEYPEYLSLAATEIADATAIEVPRGTTVDLRVVPRIPCERGTAQIGDQEVRLEGRDGVALAGRFVAREDGDLVLRLRNEAGDWLRDPRTRVVRVRQDRAPVVRILAPAGPQVVELEEPVDIVWEASDDVGLANVDLVVRTGENERRRRVGHYTRGTEPSVRGLERVVAAASGAAPGERIDVWIEATDHDEVSGPNRGRSATVTLRVASAATRRADTMAKLEAALDRGLAALADRLEQALTNDQTAQDTRKRYDAVKQSTEAFIDILREVSRAAEPGRGESSVNGTVFAEMSRRLRRKLRTERRLYRPSVAPLSRRRRTDRGVVAELESDVLLVSDVLSDARLRDAASLAKELDQLRREIQSLLSELRRADNPETRAALIDAIEQAQAQMGELQSRLRNMSNRVPEEFVNREGISATTRDALAALSEAVKRGDLEAAESELTALERQIDQLAQALGRGAEAFAEARFGPRERALAEAMDSLAGLEAEQHQLARRSGEVRRRAAARAAREQGPAHADSARRLARSARDVLRTLAGARPGRGGATDQESYDRARERVRDVADALRTGDLGEARRMAEEADREIGGMSRDLELNALMFPGTDGATQRAAQAARQASDELDAVRAALDEAIPKIDEYLDDDSAGQLRADADRQERAVTAAERLRRAFAEGPDGTPLVPDAVSALGDAQGAMRRAQSALEETQPVGASRAQQEAAEKLTELREQLERQNENSSGAGGEGEQEGGSGDDFREDVEIPSAESFRGPEEFRRRLLDAMRERVPSGFEEAVQRYYEELLH